MLKKYYYVLVGILGLTLWLMNNAHADSFVSKCPDVASCAKAMSEMLGDKYIFDVEIAGKILATSNLELTKGNAELLFTSMLNTNGLSRVALAQPKTYQIMSQRDARDSAIPTVTADQKTPPTLPDTWDLITLKYKATNPDIVDVMARVLRSFMPANSRIIPVEHAGQVFVTDTAANMKKVYDLMIELDRKPTPEMKRQWEERRKEAARERLMEKTAEASAAKTPTGK